MNIHLSYPVHITCHRSVLALSPNCARCFNSLSSNSFPLYSQPHDLFRNYTGKRDRFILFDQYVNLPFSNLVTNPSSNSGGILLYQNLCKNKQVNISTLFRVIDSGSKKIYLRFFIHQENNFFTCSHFIFVEPHFLLPRSCPEDLYVLYLPCSIFHRTVDSIQ